MLLDPNSLRHPGYWHSKFHNKLFSLFPKQHTTSLYIIGIMEKYDHIQTRLEKIFGLYDDVFSGIYDSIQIRYGVGLYGGGILHKYLLNREYGLFSATHFSPSTSQHSVPLLLSSLYLLLKATEMTICSESEHCLNGRSS